MGRSRPRALENAVIGLATGLALILGYFGLQRVLTSGPSKRASLPEASPTTRPAAAENSILSETESAVSDIPSVKVSSTRGRLGRKRFVPPPAPEGAARINERRKDGIKN